MPTSRPRSGSGDGQPRNPRGGAGARREGGRPDRSQRGERRGSGRPDRAGGPPRERRDGAAVREPRVEGPEIPEEITGKELGRPIRAQLDSLPDRLSLRVARHLAASGLLVDSDPKAAYAHAQAARALAGRLAVVREAVGETAYAAGEYAEALSELRAAKRMNGAHDYVAIMADCERALGRPDRALKLAQGAPRDKLAPPLLAELTIVEAGARRDRGELEAALRTLEHAPLQTKVRDPWVARLRYAYADALEAAGRLQDALTWFHRADAVDAQRATDAADRALRLERQQEQG